MATLLALLPLLPACGGGTEAPPEETGPVGQQTPLVAVEPPPPAEPDAPRAEPAARPQEPEWPPDTAWLKVTVLREEDGLPVPEVEVQAFCRVPDKGIVRKRGPADKDGRIAIPLDPGAEVSGVRVQPTMATAPFFQRLGHTFEAGEVMEREVRVPPAGQVEGVVLTATGEPLAGARVLAWYRERWELENDAKEPDPDVSATTDGFGRFRLGGLAQGPFTLDVEAEGQVALRRAGGVIRHGQVVRGLELLVGPARQVAGMVRDPAGQPVAGAWLVAGRAGRRRRAEPAGEEGILYYCSRQRLATTGEDGTFLLPGVPEEELWNLSVDHADFLQATGHVRPGQDFVEIRLEPGLALAGVVLEESTGKPLPGVQLRIRGLNQGRATSDDEGRFRMTGLKPDGEASLLAWRRGFAASIFWPLPVEGSREDLELRLPPGRSLAGVVREEGGQPVPGASVVLLPPHPRHPESGAEHQGALPERAFKLDHTQTGGGGGFRLQDLRAVRYRLRVETADGRQVEVEVEAGQKDLEIVLPAGD